VVTRAEYTGADRKDAAMVTRIEVEQETADRLAEKAEAKGMSVDDLLKRMLDKMDSVPLTELTLEEFDRILDELAAGSEHLPALPADLSQADIYLDHN
jgi:hypothetical protein